MTTRRELNLAVFEGTAGGVLWQPSLEQWIGVHMRQGALPGRFRGMEIPEIYDAVGCSIRFTSDGAFLPSGWPHRRMIRDYEVRHDLVRIEEHHPNHTISRIRTRAGELRTVRRGSWTVDFAVKTPEDLGVLTDFVERQRYEVNLETYHRAARVQGHRGEPSVRLRSSGFTDLIKLWCGLPGTYYLLHDHPARVEAYLEACSRRDDRLIDTALQLPCRIFSVCDHANNEFTPPPIFERFILPRLQYFSERFHAAGRFLHTHWDGNSRLMLPYLRETGLDGVEALTPAPMGDLTPEEIKKAVGEEMVVLDLLPAIFFLPDYPLADLLTFTRRIIDIFAPKLIMGVSDEMSEVGQIEKVEAISRLVDEICGLAD